MNGIYTNKKFSQNILEGLGKKNIEQTLENISREKPQKNDNSSNKFSDFLQDSLQQVNEAQKVADKKSIELSTGKEEAGIHETMLAVSQAELSFNLMVQVRNKALDAYQEIMRMPI